MILEPVQALPDYRQSRLCQTDGSDDDDADDYDDDDDDDDSPRLCQA